MTTDNQKLSDLSINNNQTTKTNNSSENNQEDVNDDKQILAKRGEVNDDKQILAKRAKREEVNEDKQILKEVNNDKQIVPKTIKSFIDPPIHLQYIALFSFIPAPGSKPREDGIYGIGKIRGVFPTMTEANKHAEYLVKHHDPLNTIYHVYCGRPFPITNVKDKFSKEVQEVQVEEINKMEKILNDDNENKKNEEDKIIKEIKAREEKLIKQSIDETLLDTQLDKYITLRVKYAQLIWTYKNSVNRLNNEVKPAINKTKIDITKMENEDNTYKENYLQKYLEARKTAHLDNNTEDNFIKYMIEDIDINSLTLH